MGLLAAAQSVEPHDITRYGTLKCWAEVLGTKAAVIADATFNAEALQPTA